VTQAVSLLGMKAAAQIVTGLVLRAAVGGKEPVAGTLLGQRRKSCRNCRLHRIDPPQGASRRRLLLRTVPRRGHSDPDAEIPDYQQTLALADKDSDRPLTVVEDERHATDHATLGYLVAKGWFLPEAICEGILYHHDPLGL
jgi:HD-like signal output (HDOD) protein